MTIKITIENNHPSKYDKAVKVEITGKPDQILNSGEKTEAYVFDGVEVKATECAARIDEEDEQLTNANTEAPIVCEGCQ